MRQRGGGEILRGVIETIPFVGRIFAWVYDPIWPIPYEHGKYSYWIIKIVNPTRLDGLDNLVAHHQYLQSQKCLTSDLNQKNGFISQHGLGAGPSFYGNYVDPSFDLNA